VGEGKLGGCRSRLDTELFEDVFQMLCHRPRPCIEDTADLGIRLSVAGSVEQAIVATARVQPNIVLLDLVMPGR